MKKFIYLVLALMFIVSPVLAADKATVGMGSIHFKSVTNDGVSSVIAANVGSFTQITVGGSQGTSAGTLIIFLTSEAVTALAKGQKLAVSGISDDSDSAVDISFLGTKVTVNGFNSTTLSIASNDDTVASGTLTVVNYNSATKELKFILSATAKPYTQISTKLGASPVTKDVNKALKVTANVIVTLP